MPKLLQDKLIDTKRVLELVEQELVRAWTKHPGEFNNAHEGHSVLREEVDELWDASMPSGGIFPRFRRSD